MARLRPSNVDPAEGALEELQRIISLIREKWHNTQIIVRGDSAYAREEIMNFCEDKEGVNYVIAISQLYTKQYCPRGEMENRIKEQQLDLFADRTSTQTFQSNQLRLWLSSIAYVLIQAFRYHGLRKTPLSKWSFYILL